MKSVVSGVAGAARIDQLTMAGLTRQEKHGKRLDKTSKARAISRDPPVTTTGLNLNALFRAHIKGAFVPAATSKAMHLIIQFPKDLVDGNDAESMLHHARRFAERVFGPEAIFGDRVDRDEKSRHVVDLFVAPKYVKKTAHQKKVAVAMTKHLKALAAEYGEPPLPVAIGRALQSAFFEYLRDEMGLEKVRRGSRKQGPGSDHKAAEQLRIEELEQLKAEALKERAEGREVGYRNGLAAAEQEAEKLRRTSEAEAQQIVEDAETKSKQMLAVAERDGRAEGLRQAEELTRREREEAAAQKVASKKDREAAAAELAAAAVTRAALEAEAQKVDEAEDKARQLVRSAEEENATATGLIAGIEAWACGDITRASETEDGKLGLWFRNEATRQRLTPIILPAWTEVWDAVVALASRAAEKALAIEAEVRDKARAMASDAIQAASAFLKRYEAANQVEQVRLKETGASAAVATFVSNPALQSMLGKSAEGVGEDDLLRRAAAAGFVKGVKIPSAGREGLVP